MVLPGFPRASLHGSECARTSPGHARVRAGRFLARVLTPSVGFSTGAGVTIPWLWATMPPARRSGRGVSQMSRPDDVVLYQDDREYEAVSLRLRKDTAETAWLEIRYHDAELAIELDGSHASELGKALLRWGAGRAVSADPTGT